MGRKLVNSEFGKNVLTLMTGSTIAQIIPIALIPVLARLFSPEEFGAYAFYTSIITFLLVMSSGRYENAIALPKEDKHAVNILVLCFTIMICFVALLFLILFCFEGFIHDSITNQSIANWIWFIPISVFFASIYKIFTYWSNRKKRFRGTSISMLSETSTRVGIQLIGGLEKYNVISEKMNLVEFFKSIFNKSYKSPSGITEIGIGTLIFSYALGFFVGTIFFLFPFLKKEKVLLKEVSWNEMKVQAKKYDNFPKITSFHALSDELKNIGLTSTILIAFNETILGFYSMTLRVLRAPLMVIGNSFSQVFYQKAAEMCAHEQNFIPLIYSTIKKMFLIAAPIFIILLLFGPALFEFVLGEKWRIAGVYAQYLTPWLFLSFAISPILQVSAILNKQGQYFLYSLVHNIIILGSVLIGGFVFNDLTIGFLILSVLQIIFYFIIFKWVMRISKAACDEFSKNSTT